MNQKKPALGIPSDSAKSHPALGSGLNAVAWDDLAVPIMANFETDAAYLRAYVRDDRTVAGGQGSLNHSGPAPIFS